MKKILTIAGSDSGCGAGIQADLKTFAAFGAYGTTAITALTAQNTKGVDSVLNIPYDFVAKQIDSVMTDIRPMTWKTGMLVDEEIIRTVCERAKFYHILKLVVDPVMIAKGGDKLLTDGAVNSLIKYLIPLSFIVTPNCHEAETLTGIHVKTIEDMKKSAMAIHKMGAKNVVVKGGHSDSVEAIDILFDGESFYEFGSERIDTKNTHGTGCTFAAAIAACLAKNNSTLSAVDKAKKYIHSAIKHAAHMHIGKGHGPLNHFGFTQSSRSIA